MSEYPFEIRSSWETGTVIIEVAGEMDMETAPQLSVAVSGVRDGADHVVVDLAAATFVDSAAINTLIHCRRELDERGVAFSVVSPRDGIARKALEITNMIDQLGVVESRSEALAEGSSGTAPV